MLPTDLIGLGQAARVACASRVAVWGWVKAGRLRSWRRVGRIFVSRAEVEGLFTEQVPAERWKGRRTPTKRQRDLKRVEEELAARGY